MNRAQPTTEKQSRLTRRAHLAVLLVLQSVMAVEQTVGADHQSALTCEKVASDFDYHRTSRYETDCWRSFRALVSRAARWLWCSGNRPT